MGSDARVAVLAVSTAGAFSGVVAGSVVVEVAAVGINMVNNNLDAVSDNAISINVLGASSSVVVEVECTISLLLLMDKWVLVLLLLVAAFVLLVLLVLDGVNNSCNIFLYNTTVSSIHCINRIMTKYAWVWNKADLVYPLHDLTIRFRSLGVL